MFTHNKQEGGSEGRKKLCPARQQNIRVITGSGGMLVGAM